MSTTSHILAPLSLKDNTDLNLAWAKVIGAQLEASLTLLCVPPEGEVDLALIREEMTSCARKLRQALGREDIHTRVEVKWDAEEDISRAAAQGDYDLVMVLTHHRSLFERLLEGSLTNDILDASALPLLAIPDDLPAPAGALGTRILVATALDDLGPLSWAKAWAERVEDARITFLYVIDTPRAHLPEVSQAKDPAGLFQEIVEGARAEVNTYLNNYPELKPLVPYEVEVRVGDSVQEISQDVRELGYDIVITGHRHRSLVGRILHGSVAEEVIQKADVPVLIIPSGAPLSP